VPQLPQLFQSVLISAQEPPQLSMPLGQHMPPLLVWPLGHPPQLVPEHLPPRGHVTQVPPQHICPVAHEFVQRPQLLALVLRSMQVLLQHDDGEQHVPPQLIVPLGHPQFVPEHLPPCGQLTQVSPQLSVPLGHTVDSSHRCRCSSSVPAHKCSRIDHNYPDRFANSRMAHLPGTAPRIRSMDWAGYILLSHQSL
jgi:hypothetical protein